MAGAEDTAEGLLAAIEATKRRLEKEASLETELLTAIQQARERQRLRRELEKQQEPGLL